MTRDPALQAYFEEAASWDVDRAARVQSQARTAWRVAAAAGVCALVSGVALVLLVPLKTVVPFVVRVDARTGIVDTVPMVGAAPPSEMVTRYLLTHYVITCLRFVTAELAESDYLECGSFHTPQRNQAWAALWARGNPQSPLNLYGDGTQVRAQVTAVTFLQMGGTAQVAQVRYLSAQHRGEGASETITHWLATVQYTYVAPSSDAQRRQWNPLGFRIVEFTPQVEAVTSERASAPQGSSGATP